MVDTLVTPELDTDASGDGGGVPPAVTSMASGAMPPERPISTDRLSVDQRTRYRISSLSLLLMFVLQWVVRTWFER